MPWLRQRLTGLLLHAKISIISILVLYLLQTQTHIVLLEHFDLNKHMPTIKEIM